jgi:hypothetical protein
MKTTQSEIQSGSEIDSFTLAYLIAAFWTNDEEGGSGDYMNTDRPEIMMGKLSKEAKEAAIADCAKFQAENALFLELAGDKEQNGHDFWLTRNGHGAGFWDRGYTKDVSETLTKASKEAGSVDLYEGDDGKLYFS